MQVNKISNANLNTPKSKNRQNKTVSTIQTERTDAASSLNVLAEQGRAQVNMSLKETSVFIPDTEMSDEEFEEAKKKIENKIKTKIQKYSKLYFALHTMFSVNKHNIYTYMKLADNPKLYENIPIGILGSETLEQAKLADRLLSDKKYFSDKDSACKMSDIISAYKSPKQKLFIEQLLSDENLYKNISEYEISAVKNCADSVPQDNLKDFLNVCRYFINAKAPDGSKIIEKYSRTPEYEALSYLMNINPSSVSASTIEMLIQLVQDGKIGRHVFEYLPKEGKIHPLVESDIDKLYEAYSLKIPPEDMFVPEFDSAEEALKCGDSLEEGAYKAVKTGDVFQVKGEKNIRIRTGEKASELLNISKTAYLKLFPPIERYASTQNNIGNCWEVSGLKALLYDAETRASVLRVFKEEGSDIIIKFPNSSTKEIRFEAGKIPETEDMQYYSKGAAGFQMLEYADARPIYNACINLVIEELNSLIQNSSSSEDKQKYENKLSEIKEAAADGIILIKWRGKNQMNLTLQDKCDENESKAYISCREGGFPKFLFPIYGFSNIEEFEPADKRTRELLASPQFFKDNAAVWASSCEGVEAPIYPHHGYILRQGKINNNGHIETFKIFNPFGTAELELTLDELIKYGRVIAVKKNAA